MALVAAPWIIALVSRPNVFDRAKRLRKEMTEAEVVAILGRPPDAIADDQPYPEYYFRPDGTRVDPQRVRALT